MNDDAKKELVEKIAGQVSDEERSRVVSDAALQFKALLFLNHKVCRSCRYHILSRVRLGKKFDSETLCKMCKIRYDKEVL
jgi:hypothetical protein